MKILAFDAPVIRVEHEDRIIGEIEHAHAHREISFALIPGQRREKYSNLYKTNSSVPLVYLKWIVPILRYYEFPTCESWPPKGLQSDFSIDIIFFFRPYFYIEKIFRDMKIIIACDKLSIFLGKEKLMNGNVSKINV